MKGREEARIRIVERDRGDRKGRALGPKAPGTCPHRPDVCFAT